MTGDYAMSKVNRDLLSSCWTAGLTDGDEILIIDGHVVADRDITYLESLLRDCTTLCMSVRSCLPVNIVSRQPQPTAMLSRMHIIAGLLQLSQVICTVSNLNWRQNSNQQKYVILTTLFTIYLT